MVPKRAKLELSLCGGIVRHHLDTELGGGQIRVMPLKLGFIFLLLV